jgi:hypothetical protein
VGAAAARDHVGRAKLLWIALLDGLIGGASRRER